MSQEKSIEELEMDLMVEGNLRRREEELDYWRKRAGWYDDDVTMKEFNNGVYDTYYQLDDDSGRHKSSSSSKANRTVGGGKGMSTFLKVGAILVAIGIAILLYRALSRRSATAKDRAGRSGTTDNKARSRSKSASRSRSSRSRSRSRRRASASAASAHYDLMDDAKSESRSRKSSRSRSRSRKHSSRGRTSRSRSKGRSTKEVLV